MYLKIRHSHLFLLILGIAFKHNKQILESHLSKTFYNEVETDFFFLY